MWLCDGLDVNAKTKTQKLFSYSPYVINFNWCLPKTISHNHMYYIINIYYADVNRINTHTHAVHLIHTTHVNNFD